MSDSKIITYIDDIRHAVTAAELNYDVWWVLKENDTREQFIDVMNNYGLFFQTSIHSHFVALLVALYRIYEKRKDTINIKELQKAIDKNKPFPPEEKDIIEKLSSDAKVIWVKVSILRNEVFAHRSNKNSIDAAFKKADITYDEFKELIKITQKLINKISRHYKKNSHAFNLSARNDTLDVLNDLLAANKNRSNK